MSNKASTPSRRTLTPPRRPKYPDSRDRFKVVPGDCNTTIAAALADLAELNWAPTFAFLDQQPTEVRWPTLQHLTRHKREDKPNCGCSAPTGCFREASGSGQMRSTRAWPAR